MVGAGQREAGGDRAGRGVMPLPLLRVLQPGLVCGGFRHRVRRPAAWARVWVQGSLAVSWPAAAWPARWRPGARAAAACPGLPPARNRVSGARVRRPAAWAQVWGPGLFGCDLAGGCAAGKVAPGGARLGARRARQVLSVRTRGFGRGTRDTKVLRLCAPACLLWNDVGFFWQ